VVLSQTSIDWGVEKARSASGELLFKSPQLPLYRMASPSLPRNRSTASLLVAVVAFFRTFDITSIVVQVS
jgi:hypothetical protein